ncbi:hypothetical protein DFS34DRAFT_635363 [Phlyctochytrium arcticum]|nr:hypothetical protein DFS34DRAFT_635363 [Phlyctochytrium arcticum]
MPAKTTGSRKRTWCIASILAVVAIALIVGLSVGLTLRNRNNKDTTNDADNSGPTGVVGAAYTGVKLMNGNGQAEMVAKDLQLVRQLVWDKDAGVILALVRGKQQVVAIATKAPSTANHAVTVILDVKSLNLELNHGLQIKDGFLYASSPSDVYRWPYTPGNPVDAALQPKPEKFVNQIDAGLKLGDTAAGHVTRTLLFDDEWLYISVGSLGNVDDTPFRSRIRRAPYKSFNGTAFNYQTLEVFADGLRNPVATTVDPKGRVWTAVNGPDNLDRPDIKADLYQDSPVEGVYRLDTPGKFYGYPYCFAAGNLTQPFTTDPSVNTMYAWPNFMNDGTHSDAWCRDTNNALPPTAALPAHSAPLGMVFSRDGSRVFIALHGSWNRNFPAGYSVVELGVDPSTGKPAADRVTKTLMALTDNTCPDPRQDSSKCFRPAGIVVVGEYLYVSGDSTGEIIRFKY